MDGTATGATATTATTARPDIRLSVVSKDSAPLVPGRRKFFRYRDLGVSAATGGRLRAQVMEAITGMTEPTGWHTHQCEAQFVFVLKGWVELEFEDGTRTRSGPGDAILIPGGMKHNEIATSDDVEILELSIPGDMATQPCDPPPGMGAGAPGR
jgi:quercetin dioxygenase-like cupin family protein